MSAIDTTLLRNDRLGAKSLLSGNGSTVLMVLLGLALVRGLLFAVLNPAFGSPDEQDHFQYIAYLATGGAIGPQGGERHQPVPYYALMVPAYLLTVGQPAAIQLLAIRILSLPFLLGIVAFTWLSGRKMAPGRPIVAILAATFVALHPQLAYVSASANNDTAANFMAAVLTYLVTCVMLGDHRRWVIPATIIAFIGTLMTKGQAIPVVAVYGIALLGAAIWQMIRRGSLRSVLYALAAAIALATVAALQSGMTEEGWSLASRSSQRLSVLQDISVLTAGVHATGMDPLSYQFVSFWAAFQGETVRPPWGAYLAPSAVVVMAVLGYAVHAAVRLVRDSRIPGHRVLLRAVLTLVIPAVWLPTYVTYIWVKSPLFPDPDYPWKTQALQGRYVLTFLVPMALLVADGWGLPAGKRWMVSAGLIAISLLFTFDVGSLVSFSAYYGWPAR